MSTNDPIKAIEEINKQYLEIINSQEYRLGKRIKKTVASIKKMNIKELMSFYKSIMVQKKIRRSQDNQHSLKEVEYYSENISKDIYRGIIYTAIIGGYEKPQEPVFYNTGFVLYTDLVKDNLKVWETREIDDNVRTMKNNYINRYYKMHPVDIFPGYDFSIYIDGNVKVISDLKPLYNLAISAKSGIAMHAHRERSCVYKEAEICRIAKRGNADAITEQMKRYRREGFPENFGLCEATVIVVDLHNPMAKKIMNDWWNEFCFSNSERDQLAFPYVLWKNGLTINDMGIIGNDLLFNPKFQITNLGDHKFK